MGSARRQLIEGERQPESPAEILRNICLCDPLSKKMNGVTKCRYVGGIDCRKISKLQDPVRSIFERQYKNKSSAPDAAVRMRRQHRCKDRL